ncbi:MAG: ATP-binding protein [Chloroflexi bacterium]|nr:ATP-binding protein [Chloroflexota bacterium]
MYQRFILPRLLNALSDTPVVVLQGARQTGKSTLAQMLVAHDFPAAYLSFDSLTTLTAVQQDPVGFIQGLRDKSIILDEVQRVPDVFLAIKAEVDTHRKPGRFLLTGSANALFLPRLADALVGRIEVLTLYPLASGEIQGQNSDFLQMAFTGKLPAPKQIAAERPEIIARALRGGYPEVLARPNPERQRDWFDSYITMLLQRDVRDLAQIHGLSELPLLLSLIAARTTASLNVSDLARAAKIPVTTLNRYLTLLQATFIVQLIPMWSSNLSSRLAKAPKLLLNDSGLLAHLDGFTLSQLENTPTAVGMLLENFVGMELVKLASWETGRPQVFCFRTHDQKEVDYVLQDRRGKIVGVEVKAASAVVPADLHGLRALAELTGKRFACGVVLYAGDQIIPFGAQLYAVPISALWRKLGE